MATDGWTGHVILPSSRQEHNSTKETEKRNHITMQSLNADKILYNNVYGIQAAVVMPRCAHA